MIVFALTKCPCCQHENPIPFGRKTSMGLWSEEKCSFCQCRLRVHPIFAILGHLLIALVLPFGLIGGLQVFQLFFSSEFGLSLGYLGLGALLGMVASGFLALWLCYALVPMLRVVSNDA